MPARPNHTPPPPPAPFAPLDPAAIIRDAAAARARADFSLIQPVPMKIARVADSPLQHRHIYDPRKIEELALSILSHGMIEPALARPMPDGCELVFAHRRKRALIAAALRKEGLTFEAERALWLSDRERLSQMQRRAAETTEILVRVVPLTDQEVLALQEAENFKREQPHPIEEAVLYERHLDLLSEEPAWIRARPEARIQEVARRLHKDPEHVARVLKLSCLAPEVRDRFFENEDLDIRLGYEIAKLHAHPTQIAAAAIVLGDPASPDERGRHPLSLSAARLAIRSRFLLRLVDGETPFDLHREDLVKDHGACSACPERAGNAVLLFPELVGEPNTCTNALCWQHKSDAQWEVDTKKIQREGGRVLSAAEARRVFFPNPHQVKIVPGSPYLDLDGEAWEGDQKTTLREKLGDHLPPITYARHVGIRVQLVRRDDVARLVKIADDKAEREQLAKAAAKKKGSAASSGGAGDDDARRAEAQKKADEKAELQRRKTYLCELSQAVVKAWPADPDAKTWKALAGALALCIWADTQETVLKRRGVALEGKSREVELLALIAKQRTGRDVVALMVELILVRSMDFSVERAEGLAKLLKLDLDKIRKAAGKAD